MTMLSKRHPASRGLACGQAATLGKPIHGFCPLYHSDGGALAIGGF